ncbi:MAG: hypothetical protein MSH15_09955 [Oscillospiraceae bacterium]|nr:hypothetical protein [Oscillospiraceae bacterium]
MNNNKKNLPGIIENSSTQKDILDYSLRELQSMPNAAISTRNGRTSVQIKTDEGTIRADYPSYSLGQEHLVSFTPRRNSFNQEEFDSTVLERLDNGQTQQEVALSMGISQSRVSQIKRKYRG